MNARLRGALVATLTILLVLGLAFSSARLDADVADVGTCAGVSVTLPFTDVPGGSLFFCAIGSAFFSGLVNGTSATTYNPSGGVTRDQMSAFVVRTQDSAVRRASRRAAAGQWATPRDMGVLKATTPVGIGAVHACFDGEDVWVAALGGTLTRVNASDGRVLQQWTGMVSAVSPISAAGFIFVATQSVPGRLYQIDPSLPEGAGTQVAGNLGDNPSSIAFDGLNLWTADAGTGPGLGSISRYNVVTKAVTIFGVGFDQPIGILFDGTHLWVVDHHADALLRVDPTTAGVLETVPMGAVPPSLAQPVFDGVNVWVPVENALRVVRTSTPAVLLATLTGNGLGAAGGAAAFDGERVLVTNRIGYELSLWKASNLAPLGSVPLAASIRPGPVGVASDGLHFWVVINDVVSIGSLLRF